MYHVRAWISCLVGIVCLLLPVLSARAQSISVVDVHPRLVYRPDGTPGEYRSFQDVRNLYNANGGNNPFQNEVNYWLGNTSYAKPIDWTSRFVITGDLSHAETALDSMVSGTLTYGSASSVETGVQWALAYDWIHSAWDGQTPPANLSTKLATIESKLATFVSASLNDIDNPGQSMWHRRTAICASAWTSSLALPTGNSTYDSLRSRAFDHWQEALQGLHTAGAWPEGPTYWATSRAIQFPLAVMSYQSAVTSAPALAVADPVEDLRQTGLWQAYTERGDGSFNRYGDISAQVQISNGTIGRSIDLYAMASNDPGLAAFAQHARQYRSRLYHSEYSWMYPVAYDPTMTKPDGYDPANPGAVLDDALPNAAVFGPEGTGMVVMRQGWESGDTQISFKAGDFLTHHGHCDQGTFTIFKNDPLVINSGGYGPYLGDHRLNYYVRTAAVNSVLVQRPDEIWNPSGVAPPGGYVNDGGQRIITATGSDIYSYDQWEAEKTSSANYEQAEITAFENHDGNFTYVASDITRAYNSTLYDSNGQGGKVSLVTRSMVYLQDADAMIVFDRVESTDPSYRKKWLLHTPNKFDGGSETVLLGSATNGILEVDGATLTNGMLTMTNGDGKLFLQVLTPSSFTARKVGGVDYRYYVEDDGNDADGLDGSNHDDYSEVSWHDYGNWRLEISPQAPATFDTFLNVLSPRDSTATSVPLADLLAENDNATVLRIGSEVIGLGTTGPIDETVSYATPAGVHEHLLVDLPAGQFCRVTLYSAAGDDLLGFRASDEGVLSFSADFAAETDISITPIADPISGDADMDGDVDAEDLADLGLHWSPAANEANWAHGDFDNDGDVDANDLASLGLHWNPAGTIPEPACGMILLAGWLGVSARRRKTG